MSVVTIASSVDGYTAQVDEAGRVAVASLPPLTEVEQSSPTAANGASSEVVAALAGRTCLAIQNLGAFPVALSLAGTSRPATATDITVAPGTTFELCGHARYEGAVQAIGVGGASQLAVLQHRTA